MVTRRVLILIGAAAAGALVVVLVGHSGSGLSSEELARRISVCHPTWQNYQEDIKGQIGAGPVAQWMGALIEAQCESSVIKVSFRLSGPWAERNPAIPILVREPSGNVYRDARTRREGEVVTYTYQLLENSLSLPLPWLEIKYPHGERRLVLSEDGRWRAPSAP